MAPSYEVEVKMTSARDVKNVNWRHGLTRPYAVVWVDPRNKCTTRADDDNDTNPSWDQTLTIPIPGPITDDTALYVDVVHAGSEPDTNRLIGSARLRLREIGLGEHVSRTLDLVRPSGRPHGRLEVTVSVRDPYAYALPPPATVAYGAPAHDPYYGAAPSGHGGAPYGQPGYGGVAVAEEKKSKFGGMGTGLAVGAAAGLLGGLALAEGIDYVEDEIADDVAEQVEDDLDGGD